jgi:hypothetical protein
VDVRPADHHDVVAQHDLDGSRGCFERASRAVRGRRLTAVDYWDVHSFGSEPAAWDYGDWHHAVMGVQLGTDQGPVTVTWTSTFYPYGVDVFLEPIEHHLVLGEAGPERVGTNSDATGAWGPCLGSLIRGTACHWARLEIGPGRRADGSVAGPAYSVELPVALRLDFDAAAMWFVAGIPQLPDTRRVFIPGDEIMVVFSREKMRDMGFDDAAFLQSPQ